MICSKDISKCDVVHFNLGVGDTVVPEPLKIKTQSIFKKEKPDLLKRALKACFEHRNTSLPESIYKEMHSFDFMLSKKGWLQATSSLKEKVSFESCAKIILKELKHKAG